VIKFQNALISNVIFGFSLFPGWELGLTDRTLLLKNVSFESELISAVFFVIFTFWINFWYSRLSVL
jgi:hypothetical protein